MLRYLKKSYTEKNIYAMVVALIFTVFSFTYVRHVIMPQQGWWHYYAWRVLEGDILYKDLYLFIPPYFTFLTSILYKVFSNEFFKYIIYVGYPIKIAVLIILYYTLTRITQPAFACVAVLFGACVSATYLMDVWYDYNPVLMLPCVLICYLSMKMYDERYLNLKIQYYSLFIGVLIGILFMSKQTLGISYLTAYLIFNLLLLLKEKLEIQIIKKVFITCLIGILVGILPGIIYLIQFDCFNNFIKCLGMATSAKGGGSGLIEHLIGIMTQWRKWVVALFFILYIYHNEIEKLYKIKINGKAKILCCILLCVILAFLCIKINRIKPVVLLLSFFIVPSIIEYYVKSKLNVEFNHNIAMIITTICLISMYLWANVSSDYHAYLYNEYHIFKMRRISITIASYIFTMIWIKELFYYFNNKGKNVGVLVFMSMIYVHFLTGIVSAAVFEEIFMVLYIPWVIVYLFNSKCIYNVAKNTSLILLFICCVFSSITSKQVIPYDWQGWRTMPIREDDRSSAYSNLYGYKISDINRNDFDNVINIIKNNTSENDGVYQFASIPMFNVLTNRKIPVYGPISWFDVLPDDIAVRNSNQLITDNPKLVIWHKMSEGEWDFLEKVYRNGKRSGQREIKRFYDEVVKTKYKKIYSFYNNRDGDIEVYLRK